MLGVNICHLYCNPAMDRALSPSSRCRNQGSEGLSKVAKLNQLVSGRSGIETRPDWLQIAGCSKEHSILGLRWG